MEIITPVAPGDLKTSLSADGHTHSEACPSLSPHHKQSELDAIAAANDAIEKATREAARIRAEAAHRHNCFVDAVAAFREALAVERNGAGIVAEAEGDYARNVGKLELGIGAVGGSGRASWDFARQIAAEKVGIEILREAAAKLPERRKQAEKALRAVIKEHSIAKELWPAGLE